MASFTSISHVAVRAWSALLKKHNLRLYATTQGMEHLLGPRRPHLFYEQPSHRFTDMGCEHKMMANAKNCLLRADAGVRLNNLMKPDSSHISLRTWSARKGHTHVKNGLLHEYLARRCTGVECFAQEAQSTTVCNNSRDGTSSCTEAPAPFWLVRGRGRVLHSLE